MMADTEVDFTEVVSEHVVDGHLIETDHEGLIVESTLLHTTATTSSGQPPAKRIKLDDDALLQMTDNVSIKQILFNINQAICLRLDAIENKLESVSTATKVLEQKLEDLHSTQSRTEIVNISAASSSMLSPSPSRDTSLCTPVLTPSGLMKKSGAVVVGLPQPKTPPTATKVGGAVTPNDSLQDDDLDDNGPDRYVVNLAGSKGGSALDHGIQNLGPNVMLITLNSEEDFPNGTWLGDESNPEMRVRVPVTPSDLLHIHSNCRTAEKMALTLLDYLFDRETQAYSNLSGIGKHGKKQLDPLMIYGIRCHLIHHFNITEQDWHRLKQNINSKCRTAFRRKIRGLPLTVKAFRGKAPPTYIHVSNTGVTTRIHGGHDLGDSDDSLQHGDDELQIQEAVDISEAGLIPGADLLQNAGGHIQVLHATPEQVAQLQQTHQIQILQGDQIMQFQTGDHHESIHVAVPMSNQDHDAIQVIHHTDDGETLTLDPGTVITDVTEIATRIPKVEEHPDSD